MFLYENNKNKIFIYECIESKEKAKEYRKKKMQEFSAHGLVLTATSFDTFKPLEIKDDVQYKFLDVKDLYRLEYTNVLNEELDLTFPRRTIVHGLEKEKDGSVRKRVLNAYYNSGFPDKKTVIVTENGNLSQTLLITDSYHRVASSTKTNRMKGIIHLPNELFLLQMLEQEQLSLIQNQDISEPLCAFDFNPEPIYCIEIDNLEKAILSNLVSGDIEQIMDKVDTTYKILQKVREVNSIK